MKKVFAHEVNIGDNIDWYGHGEFIELGEVLNKRTENNGNSIILTISDKYTSNEPFEVRKSKYSSVTIN